MTYNYLTLKPLLIYIAIDTSEIIVKPSEKIKKAYQLYLEHDEINLVPVDDPDSFICIIKDVEKMVLVHGMYERARGNITHDLILRLELKKHTYLISTQLNLKSIKYKVVIKIQSKESF